MPVTSRHAFDLMVARQLLWMSHAAPDVRRMLMTGRALTEANRALAYTLASGMDVALRHPDGATRARHQALADFLIPVHKGWATECGIACLACPPQTSTPC